MIQRWWIHLMIGKVLCHPLGMTLGSTTTLVLPIFPLRKRVKLPGDRLHLRLWEPRYIALSDYIRDSKDPRHVENTLGVMYASHKPQYVARGKDPITPMIDPGDVGVLCQGIVQDSYIGLQSDEKNMNEFLDIDTDVSTKEKQDYFIRNMEYSTRVTELECVATQRFRVERILQHGRIKSGDSLPFLLVEATCFNDIINPSEYDEMHAMVKRLGRGSSSSSTLETTNFELLSFQLLSSVSERMTAREVLQLLEMTSTKDRLTFVVNKIE